MKKLFALVIASAMVSSFACASDLVPASSGSQSLGQAALRWLNGYFNNVYTTNFTSAGTVTFEANSISLDALDSITATAAEINLVTAMKTANIGSVGVSIATNANGGTNVVTFTGKDLAGTQLTGYHTLVFYVADSQYGAPAAVAGDIVISGTGAAELFQMVDKAEYMIQLSNGVAVATITDTPGGTNYIHTINSAGVISAGTPSAFNVP